MINKNNQQYLIEIIEGLYLILLLLATKFPSPRVKKSIEERVGFEPTTEPTERTKLSYCLAN